MLLYSWGAGFSTVTANIYSDLSNTRLCRKFNQVYCSLLYLQQHSNSELRLLKWNRQEGLLNGRIAKGSAPDWSRAASPGALETTGAHTHPAPAEQAWDSPTQLHPSIANIHINRTRHEEQTQGWQFHHKKDWQREGVASLGCLILSMSILLIKANQCC